MKNSSRASTDPARQTAFLALQDVLQASKTLDDAFETRASSLTPRDRAFAYNLAATTLRHSLALDKRIQPMMKKPFPRNSSQQILLRLGLCQLFLMDGVKDHAAISTTVELAKQNKLAHLSGVINGVLRNSQRKLKRADIAAENPLPAWLWQKLKTHYGHKADALKDPLLQPAPLDIRCTVDPPPQGAEKLPGLPDGWRLPPDTKPADLQPHLNSGSIYIQDAAAQWPGYLLARHLESSGPLLDICAAPGGKTLQLADLTKQQVVGADISGKRLCIMARNTRQRQNIHLCLGDGFRPPFPDGIFAGILVDAPCTATGTLRRHPEVMHLRSEKDLRTLQDRQRELVKAMAPLLAEKGILAYAVCSLLAEEGEAQDRWIRDNTDLRPLAIKDLPVAFRMNQPTENALRLTPLDGMDGFYIALYQKTH